MIAPVDVEAFGGMLPSWPHFPGAGHVRYRQFVPAAGERPGEGLWRVLADAVRERDIPVAFRAPAVEPLTGGDSVAGAIIDEGGTPRRIAARAGVVLASGSFEADAELRDTYLPLPLGSVGHQGNTGDTLRLAQRAGASLWHMSAFFGWLAFVHPDYPVSFTLDLSQGPSVVTLYLLPSLNARLLPQLRKLPPGTRVISVAHRMADVKPDGQIVVDTELGEFDVYLWKAETLRGH